MLDETSDQGMIGQDAHALLDRSRLRTSKSLIPGSIELEDAFDIF